MNDYKNKVSWCPMCNQGWVQIVKEIESSNLYLCCSECETEWAKPDDITDTSCLPFESFGKYISPTQDELKLVSWDQYIIKDHQ